MKHIFLTAIGLTFLATPGSVHAQEAFDFFSRGPYRAEVPEPDQLLGYNAGQRHTQYSHQQRVLDQLMASAGDRVRAEQIGITEEGRVMRALLISSPTNLARLDEIRSDMARLADPRDTSPEEAAEIAARNPVVVFLSYSIHGNEPAGFEAAMWVAYQLLASNEPATRTILDSVLVVLNPSANPDGHERFAVWYNSLSVGTDEPFAFEATEPWSIWGRFSHYRFDMNRDLIAQSQAPVRAMLGAMMRWHPQVFVDHHSTTSQFFFPPPALPLNPNYPGQTVKWMERFGRGNAGAFDRYGWQYYVRDIFDLFYAGYFDAWPSLNGATGMTYESDGGPELAIRRADNTVITFRDGIAHHWVASMATLETAAMNRHERLMDYYDFRRSSIAERRKAPMKRVIVIPDNDRTNAARLTSLLLRQDIEVGRLTAPYAARNAHSYMRSLNAPSTEETFPPGTLVIDLDQPQGRLAKALLEPDPDLGNEFKKRQLEKFERNRRRGDNASSERYDFYDITAWALPQTLGLAAYWTEDLKQVSVERVELPADPDPVTALQPAGGVEGRATAAYLFKNDRQSAVKLAVALLAADYTLNVATEDFRAGDRAFPRGTYIVHVNRNPASLHDDIRRLAAANRVPVAAVNSNFPDVGRVGIGSESVRPIFRPRVLVATGREVSQTSYGALWYFLERELKLAFVPVSLRSIRRMNTMSDYNVLIIPSGNPASIQRALGSGGTDRLKQWVRDGGVLIAYGRAALLASRKGIELSTIKSVGDTGKVKADSVVSDPAGIPPLVSPTAGSNRPTSLPGTIFRATLDRSHWLTLGYASDELAVMMRGSTFLKPSEKGDNPVSFVGDSLLLGGFEWPDTETKLDGTVWAASENHGRGKVVIFAGEPLFRAFWRGPAKLLTNAILFGPNR